MNTVKVGGNFGGFQPVLHGLNVDQLKSLTSYVTPMEHAIKGR
jgi:hypothetical protein